MRKRGQIKKMKDKEYLYLVALPGKVTYGIVVSRGKITYAPPIAKWAISKKLEHFREWVGGREGTVSFVTSGLRAKEEK